MRLKIICSVFYFFTLVFPFANPTVQFTEPVKSILLETAQEDALGWDIHSIEGKRAIQKLFKKDCFENEPIYAKILLENENKTLLNVREKLMVLELLNRTKVIFLVWYKNFGMTYEQARGLEYSFRETMQLIDPLYH